MEYHELHTINATLDLVNIFFLKHFMGRSSWKIKFFSSYYSSDQRSKSIRIELNNNQDLDFNCPRSRLSLLTRSASCRRNPSLGRTSRCRRHSVSASTAVIFCLSIKQAKTHVLDRDIPIRQLTRTFPGKESSNFFFQNNYVLNRLYLKV